MSARKEVQSRIYHEWKDKQVAHWVINRLPLLALGFSHPACPVYTLSLDTGLLQVEGPEYPVGEYLAGNKFVMSGGFEGTVGHLKNVSDMHEVRALTAEKNTSINILLEPDSYIERLKNRSPLVRLRQRVELWASSGLVNAVVVLPEQDMKSGTEGHYKRIHHLLNPAKWFASIENSYWRNILKRQGQQTLDTSHLFEHYPEIHASFLDETRDLNTDELRQAVMTYVTEMVESIELRRERSYYFFPDNLASILAGNILQDL